MAAPRARPGLRVGAAPAAAGAAVAREGARGGAGAGPAGEHVLRDPASGGEREGLEGAPKPCSFLGGDPQSRSAEALLGPQGLEDPAPAGLG